MRRLAAAVAVAVLAVASGALAGKVQRSTSGVLEDQMVSAAASHFTEAGGDGANAGAIASATASLEDLGFVEVVVSSSWDWSGFDSDHPCALMNVTPHRFAATNGFLDTDGDGVLDSAGAFTAYATVTISTVGRGDIEGTIRGGSVCEIDVVDACTTNESMTAFDIDGGTVDFALATGEGFIRTIFDFCANAFVTNEIFLDLQN